MPGIIIVSHPTRTSTLYMLITAVVGLVLGGIMLFYPGGTLSLMETGFKIFKLLLSIFIIYFALSEAVPAFRAQHQPRGISFLVLGGVALILVWVLKVGILYWGISFFLLVTGVSLIVSSFSLPEAKLLVALLGLIDIMFAVAIVTHPVVLALIIAWYVLFWGISRLFLALELRKVVSHESPPH